MEKVVGMVPKLRTIMSVGDSTAISTDIPPKLALRATQLPPCGLLMALFFFHRCDRPVALRYGIEVHRYRNTPTSTVSTYVHLDTPFSAPCIAILHPSERQSSKKHCQPLLSEQRLQSLRARLQSTSIPGESTAPPASSSSKFIFL